MILKEIKDTFKFRNANIPQEHKRTIIVFNEEIGNIEVDDTIKKYDNWIVVSFMAIGPNCIVCTIEKPVEQLTLF